MGRSLNPSDSQPNDDALNAKDQLALEALIRSASHYVVPSDKLRGQVLHTAREQYSDRRSERAYLEWVWALVIVACLLVPVVQTVSAYSKPLQGRTAKQIEEQAIQLAHDKNIEVEWGLVEVFSRIRQGSVVPSSP
jgi:hypothetical protein